ncbi:MAG: hypothetical protein GY832_03650 [Chloroflexi bacterium]|nr:hypothetical protein [Chloroflexota bacterium]
MQAFSQFRQKLAIEQEPVEFKRNAIGWALTVANTLSALWSTFVFLFSPTCTEMKHAKDRTIFKVQPCDGKDAALL